MQNAAHRCDFPRGQYFRYCSLYTDYFVCSVACYYLCMYSFYCAEPVCVVGVTWCIEYLERALIFREQAWDGRFSERVNAPGEFFTYAWQH